MNSWVNGWMNKWTHEWMESIFELSVSQRLYLTSKNFVITIFYNLLFCLLKLLENTHYIQVHLLDLCYSFIAYKIVILKGTFSKFSSTISHFSNSVVNIYRHFKPVNRIELLSALIDEGNKVLPLLATKSVSVWLKCFVFVCLFFGK